MKKWYIRCMKTFYISFLSLISLFYSCAASTGPTDTIPKHETITIYSNALNEERVINIWLPIAYDTSSTPLKVLYMADGGVKEDFPHVANTLSDLIQYNKIEPIVLVGVENTQRRRDLTPITTVENDKEIAPIVGGSKNFRTFIKSELFPAIAAKYKVDTLKGIIGESAAGLFIMETFMDEPDLFDYYIVFDPSLWWNNQYLINNLKNSFTNYSNKPKSLWFASSGAKDINKHVQTLDAELKKYAPNNVKWHYENKPKEKHTTIFRATKDQALIYMFGK